MQLSTLLHNLRIFVSLMGICCVQFISAQAFIPDLNMRQWLNDAIPGIVDVSGIMDTLHPNIAMVDSISIEQSVSETLVDLDGLQYLDSLKSFEAYFFDFTPQNSLAISCSALPAALERFKMRTTYPGTIDLPQFPNTTTRIEIRSIEVIPLNIAGLSNNLETLIIASCQPIAWGPPVFVQNLILECDNTVEYVNLSFPPISANYLSLFYWEGGINGLDLSTVAADHVQLSHIVLNGYVQWPLSMTRLDLIINVIDNIGDLPNTLQHLELCSNGLQCLPYLPNGLTLFRSLCTSDINCLPNLPIALQTFECASCMDQNNNIRLCSVLNSQCVNYNAGISGHIFVDLNQNGQLDIDEPAVTQASISTSPVSYLTGCDFNGFWEMGVLPDTYTITPSIVYPYVQSVSPSTHVASVPNIGDVDTLNDFAAQLIPNIQDLRTFMVSGPARPGFDNRLFLNCENYGTIPMNSELILEFDNAQTWTGSSIPPNQLSGNTAIWQLPTLAFGEELNFTVDLYTNPNVPLNTPLFHLLTAGPISTDETPSDNVYSIHDNVVGSYDPNDKLVDPKELTPLAIQAGNSPLEYTIRFQNTGTYPAERVVIVDTLSEDLQWNSFEFLSSSHPCHWYITDGVLHFIHDGIVLPDSTNNEPNSHGYVKFRIKPSTDLQLGASVTNIAHIVFDFNEPIVTPPAIFTIDELTGVEELSSSGISVYPNPVEDVLMISLANSSSNETYVIRNVLGQDVLQGRLNGNGQLDVSELHHGQYAIEVITDDAKYVQRFMKN